MSWTVHLGDSLAVLKTLADGSVDAVVTDPPYGLRFMQARWDYDVPGEELWRECLRVLKPGGHLLAFAGTRTQHRMAVRIEDAGFEIRDMVAWVYGSGFPKSLDVSKALDKMAGAAREVISEWRTGFTGTLGGKAALGGLNGAADVRTVTAPATPAAKEWQGWGTALKPSFEPITMARKPLGEGTVAANVLAWGVGGINVDGCRVACNDKAKFPAGVVSNTESVFGGGAGRYADRPRREDANASGRWPANLVHDGSEEVVGLFPVTTSGGTPFRRPTGMGYHGASGQESVNGNHGDTGSAARFFKTCEKERLCALCGLLCVEFSGIIDACETVSHATSHLNPAVHPVSIAVANVKDVEPPATEAMLEQLQLRVKNAGLSLSPTQAIDESIVHRNALLYRVARNVMGASGADSLCERCAISIAHALVVIKTWGSNHVELQVILGYMGSSVRCILIQNLAAFAAIWESIDIIPTTQSLSILYGSVRHAIDELTKQDASEQRSLSGAHRFGYFPKASRREREAGCEGLERRKCGMMEDDNYPIKTGGGNLRDTQGRNHHPTVKPIALMRWLCRLITPPGGLVLDPFMGSGTTGCAAILEGFNFVGIEREPEYIEIARRRITYWAEQAEAEREADEEDRQLRLLG